MTIPTIHGDMDDSLLEKRTGMDADTDDHRTTWVEYWLNGELVHRSVDVKIKRWPTMVGEIGRF